MKCLWSQFLSSSVPGGGLGDPSVERQRPEEETPRADLRPSALCRLHPPPLWSVITKDASGHLGLRGTYSTYLPAIYFVK